MIRYKISDECRYYLDAILPAFHYNRITDIRRAIKDVFVSEGGDSSNSNINGLYFEIIRFLQANEFGHEIDYVFIIDAKGNDLKHSGSLKNYEEKINSN